MKSVIFSVGFLPAAFGAIIDTAARDVTVQKSLDDCPPLLQPSGCSGDEDPNKCVNIEIVDENKSGAITLLDLAKAYHVYGKQGVWVMVDTSCPVGYDGVITGNFGTGHTILVKVADLCVNTSPDFKQLTGPDGPCSNENGPGQWVELEVPVEDGQECKGKYEGKTCTVQIPINDGGYGWEKESCDFLGKVRRGCTPQ